MPGGRNVKRILLAISILLLGTLLNGCLVIRTHGHHGPGPHPYTQRR